MIFFTGRRIRQLEAQLESTRELAAEYAQQAQEFHQERDQIRELLQSAHACINLQPKSGQAKVKQTIDMLGGWTWKK